MSEVQDRISEDDIVGGQEFIEKVAKSEVLGSRLRPQLKSFNGTRAFFEALKNNLKELYLDLENVQLQTTLFLRDMLKVNQHLTWLNLSYCRINDEGMTAIVEGMKLNKSIKWLYLSRNLLSSFGNEIGEMLKINESLEVLDLGYNSFQYSDSLGSFASGLKLNRSLRCLSLRDCHVGVLLYDVIDALKSNTSLTELDLNGNNLGSKGGQAIAEMLEINKTLTRLDLSRNYLDDGGVLYVARALEVNSALRSINLSDNFFGEEGGYGIAKSLKINKSLTELDIGWNYPLGAEVGKVFGCALVCNTQLIAVNLDHCGLGADGCKAIADAVKENSFLIDLNLDNNEMGCLGARAMKEALKSNKSLKKLSLCEIDFGDEGAKELAEMLKLNTSLTSLCIRHCGFGTIGAKAFAAALKVNKSVMFLDMSYTNLDDQAAIVFADTLKINRSLSWLDMSGHNFGENCIKAFMEMLEVNRSLTTLEIDTSSRELENSLTRNKQLDWKQRLACLNRLEKIPMDLNTHIRGYLQVDIEHVRNDY